MFFKKQNVVQDLDSPSTVIGKGIYLEAVRMTGQETVRIDGIYKGSIDIDGSLVLGDSGSITGNINAKYFLVAGEVDGNITCETQLHFASTARVVGDIKAPSIIVDEGSQVFGKYSVGEERLVGLANKGQHLTAKDEYNEGAY
ncbi:MAG: polymer-forming cytoskeletal protein [Defluviitaleaceae bacterium]|nr:polymer-forming cytoskeletal protein [Defluviitaleaceae bacterium]